MVGIILALTVSHRMNLFNPQCIHIDSGVDYLWFHSSYVSWYIPRNS